MLRLLLTAAVLAVAPVAWAGKYADGHDLEAWRAIDTEAYDVVTAYRAFLTTYPDSTLAERAWDRLALLDEPALPGEADAATRRQLAQVERSWRGHVSARQREVAVVAPGSLDPDGLTPTPQGARQSLSVEALTGSDDSALCAGAGIAFAWGLGSAHLRVLGAQKSNVELGLRGTALMPPGVFGATRIRSAYAEVTVDPYLQAGLTGGLGARVARGLDIEASAGVLGAKRELMPRMRVGLRWTPTLWRSLSL